MKPTPEIYTNDPQEWVDRCLHCTEKRCSGTCPERRSGPYQARVRALAQAIHSGMTIQQVAERVGITPNQVGRYMKTKLYGQEMGRLREKTM